MELLKVYKEFKSNKKIKNKNLIEREINDSFDVSYKNGGIFIVHQGEAVEELNNSTTIEEVITEIKSMQKSSIKYKME